MTINRRTLLRTVAAATGSLTGMTASASAPTAAPAGGGPFGWNQLAGQYDFATDFVNPENAYYGVMARPVLDDYKRNIRLSEPA